MCLKTKLADQPGSKPTKAAAGMAVPARSLHGQQLLVQSSGHLQQLLSSPLQDLAWEAFLRLQGNGPSLLLPQANWKEKLVNSTRSMGIEGQGKLVPFCSFFRFIMLACHRHEEHSELSSFTNHSNS